MFQNLWDAAKAVLRGKFIAIYIGLLQEVKTFNFIPKELKKKKKHKTNRRKDTIKIRAEINKLETKTKNKKQ